MAFMNPDTFDPKQIRINIQHNTRTGKETVVVSYGEALNSIAFVTPPAVTHWPRCTGDGNFRSGTYGAETLEKAQLTIDLSCDDINNAPNEKMLDFQTKVIGAIDEAVLDFFFQNQVKLLGRRNLSRDELRVLQIRSSKEKINRESGIPLGKSMNASTRRQYFDAVGNKRERDVNICDMDGTIIENPKVYPGDIVAAAIQLDHVYTGIGGDKFGCHWQLHDVCIITQSHKVAKPTAINTFDSMRIGQLSYATAYEEREQTAADFPAQAMNVSA